MVWFRDQHDQSFESVPILKHMLVTLDHFPRVSGWKLQRLFESTYLFLLLYVGVLPIRATSEKFFLKKDVDPMIWRNQTAYGEQGPAKLSRHKAAKPLNLDHAAKPRSHKATCKHSLTGASQRHKAAKLQKTQNVVEFECTKSAAKASRNTLACMAGHEPRLWCFSSLWRFETLWRFDALRRFVGFKRLDALRRFEMLRRFDAFRRLDALGATKDIGCSLYRKKAGIQKFVFEKKFDNVTIVVLLKISFRRFPRRILRNTTLEDFSWRTTFILTIVSKTLRVFIKSSFEDSFLKTTFARICWKMLEGIWENSLS